VYILSNHIVCMAFPFGKIRISYILFLRIRVAFKIAETEIAAKNLDLFVTIVTLL